MSGSETTHFLQDFEGVTLEDVRSPGVDAFMTYWESKKLGKKAPYWSDFHLSDLPSHIIPFILVVDVKHDPFDLIFRYWGTGHTRRKGFDKTGKSVFDPPSFRDQRNVKEYARIVSTMEPLAARGLAAFDEGPDLQPFYSTLVRCPLLGPKGDVDHIVTYAEWEKD